MAEADAASLRQEIQFQDQHRFDHLPSGVIHADLFKDNVLMDGDKIAGFIDFYYACNDILLYDVAIAFNDWTRLEDGSICPERASAFLAGYQSVRVLTAEENSLAGDAARCSPALLDFPPAGPLPADGW
jgi:homoserine kinase type II